MATWAAPEEWIAEFHFVSQRYTTTLHATVSKFFKSWKFFRIRYQKVRDGGLPNQRNFRESSMGRGVIFKPKIYIADFGNFKQGFLSMKLIQKGHFRVQGMFFQQLYWEKSKQDTLWRRHFWIPPPFVSKIHPFWWHHPSLKEKEQYEFSFLTGVCQFANLWVAAARATINPVNKKILQLSHSSRSQWQFVEITMFVEPVHLDSFMTLLVPLGHASVAMCHKICAGR